MGAASYFRSQNLTTVAGRTYPGTYSIATVGNFMAEQVANRDSASWKKAEHIAIESPMPNEVDRKRIVERWRMLTYAEPFGKSIQKLYIYVGNNRYARYNADGNCTGIDTLQNLMA